MLTLYHANKNDSTGSASMEGFHISSDRPGHICYIWRDSGRDVLPSYVPACDALSEATATATVSMSYLCILNL